MAHMLRYVTTHLRRCSLECRRVGFVEILRIWVWGCMWLFTNDVSQKKRRLQSFLQAKILWKKYIPKMVLNSDNYTKINTDSETDNQFQNCIHCYSIRVMAMHQYCPIECLSNKQCSKSDWAVCCRYTHSITFHPIWVPKSTTSNLVVPKSNLSKIRHQSASFMHTTAANPSQQINNNKLQNIDF